MLFCAYPPNITRQTYNRKNRMKIMIQAIGCVVCCLLISAAGEGCGSKENPTGETSGKEGLSGTLIIFHAGSLSVPFKEISQAFTKNHPDLEILREAAGSRSCARKISDLGRKCDIMASADYTVIDTLLIPEHADWNIRFATNEMTLVYHNGSRGSDAVTGDNWYSILLREDVVFSRSDPNADPCGYRAVLTMKLAEKYYGIKGLADKLLAKDTAYIRPKETDLLGLLESNEIDYIFLYRSVAEQHGLKYVLLPDEINLKKADMADTYKTVSVKISGKKPGEFIIKKGAPMVYGITIPQHAPHPEAALAFAEFMLDRNRGMRIMERNGQPSAVPSFTDTYENLPDTLKNFAKP